MTILYALLVLLITMLATTITSLYDLTIVIHKGQIYVTHSEVSRISSLLYRGDAYIFISFKASV